MSGVEAEVGAAYVSACAAELKREMSENERLRTAIRKTLAILRSGAEQYANWPVGVNIYSGTTVINAADFAVARLERCLEGDK